MGNKMKTTTTTTTTTTTKFNLNKLTSAVLSVLCAASVSSYANAADEPAADIEVIQVTGIKGSLVQSINNKRFSDSIIDGISAEDVGKFPDQNVAESLQRITGVTIDRNGGEGSKVSIRGFGPDFNKVLLNNRTLPTSDSGRAFSFDILASELISGADVHKTSTASQIEGAIGGVVDIKTMRPFDLDGFTAVGSAKANYDTLSEDTSPSFSGLISQNFDEDFALLASFAYQSKVTQIDSDSVRGYRQDPVITGSDPYGEATSEKYWRPQAASQTIETRERDRIGGTLVAQWAPNDDTVITADVLYSKLDSTEDKDQLSRWFSSPLYNSKIDENGTVTSFNRIPKTLVSQGVYQLWDDGTPTGIGQWNSANKAVTPRENETTMVGFNVEWQATNDLMVFFDAQTSKTTGESGDGFIATLANPAQTPVSFALQGDSFEWTGPQSKASDYYANNVQVVSRDYEDEVSEVRLDTEYSLDIGYFTTINTGLYYSTQEKSYKQSQNQWSNTTATNGFKYNIPADVMSPLSGTDWFTYNPADVIDFFLSDDIHEQTSNVGAQVMHNFANGDPKYASEAEAQAAADAASQAALDKLLAMQAYSPVGTSGDSQWGPYAPEFNPAASWTTEEENIAAYIQASLSGDDWSANLGLRYIETKTTSQSASDVVTNVALDSVQLNALLNRESGQQVIASSDYSDILPSLNVKYEASEDIVVRFAFSESLTRPSLQSLTPNVRYQGSGSIDGNYNVTDWSGTIKGQNPELKPYKSTNYDVSVEWYYDEASTMSVAYFKKDIADWITSQTRTTTEEHPTTRDGVPGTSDSFDFEKTAPFNNDSSDAQGIEFALLHNFDSGFGTQVNYTYMDSSAAFDPNSDKALSFTLDGLSKNSYNVIGFYENETFQARLAYNWRSDYVNCGTCGLRGQPVQTEAYGQFDASVSYDINENFTVFAEGVNITNETTAQYSTYSSRFLSLTETGAKFSVGVRASF